MVVTRDDAIRAAVSGAGVSILCSLGAWLALFAARLGAPWFPFIPGFLLLGATAPLVAFVSFFVERTAFSGIACVCSMTAPVAFAIWWSHLPPDAFSWREVLSARASVLWRRAPFGSEPIGERRSRLALRFRGVCMAGMSDPRELFLHELGDVLYAENVLVKALPKLAEEASDEELALGFEEHLDETRQHVKNIEQAFEQLGEEPSAEQCPGIDGIKKEHDDFVSKESPSQDVLDSFLTGAGARTEHYEIAAYEGLVTMAEAMGETEVVELLTQNLEQETVALEKLQTIGKRLAKEGAKQQTRA